MSDDRGVRPVRVVRIDREWGSDDGWGGGGIGFRGPFGLSPLGLFLLIVGALLLLDQLVPEWRVAAAAVLVALGVGLLARWLVERRQRRGTWRLYAGALLVALSLAPLLDGLGILTGPGWGTLFVGGALVAIALLRAAEGGGWGWQLRLGAFVALVGGLQIGASRVAGFPSLGQIVWPLLLLALGGWFILRGAGRR